MLKKKLKQSLVLSKFGTSPKSVKVDQMGPERLQRKGCVEQMCKSGFAWKADGVLGGESEDKDCDICKMRWTRR